MSFDMQATPLSEAPEPVIAAWPPEAAIESYRGYTMDLTPVRLLDGFAARAAMSSRTLVPGTVLSPQRGPFTTPKEAVDCARIYARNYIDLRAG